MASRWGIPKDVEELVKQRDLSCVYCGVPFTNEDDSHARRPTWEHIINDVRINGLENVALCCGSCNASKGSRELRDWLTSKYCLAKGINKDKVSAVVKSHLEQA